MTTKVFPCVLVRVAGAPFDTLRALELEESTAIAEKMYEAGIALHGLRSRVGDALYSLIGEQGDRKERVRLINFRRDIFNGRRISRSRAREAQSVLPRDVRALVREYLNYSRKLGVLQERGLLAYNREISTARRHLAGLTQLSVLENGLLLSSQSLLWNGLERYRSAVNQRRDARTRRTEASLLKYLARVCAKTSPFSTFTSMAIVNLGNAGDGSGKWKHDPNTRKVVSHVQPNNYLLRSLRGGLCRVPEVYRRLPLRLNSTVRRRGRYYSFLVNWDNRESFQRLRATDAIASLVNPLRVARGGIVYADVAHALLAMSATGSTLKLAEAYLNRLVACGIVEFSIDASGADPQWDRKLGEQLSSLASDVPIAMEVVDVLGKLREVANRYGEAGVASRARLLAEACERVNYISVALAEAGDSPNEATGTRRDDAIEEVERGQENRSDVGRCNERAGPGSDRPESRRGVTSREGHSVRPERVFYEDTVAPAVPPVDGEQLRCLTELLSGLLGDLGIFDSRHGERERMRMFFLQRYGAEKKVPLLAFYEDYFREIRVPEAEWAARKGEDAGQERVGSPEDEENKPWVKGGRSSEDDVEIRLLRGPIYKREEEVRDWLKGLEATVRSQIEGDCEEICFARKDIHDFNGEVAFASEKTSWESFGMMCQLLYDDEREAGENVKAVINAVSIGYGKLMSRFLHMFDVEIADSVRRWNAKPDDAVLLAECTDASYFNANIHPPLMPYEIQMPGGHNRLPEDRRIQVGELSVAISEKKNELALTHSPSGKPVWVFDLGFQSPRGRSELFNLLSYFSPAPSVGTWPLVRAVTNVCCGLERVRRDGERRAIIIPRIVYEGRLILQRRAWLVPVEMLPAPVVSESGWEHFVRVDRWRRDLGLPDDVFVYLAGRQGIDSLLCGAAGKLGRDDYKPQYVGFRNPFAVSIFGKITEKSKGYIRIEEMLPCPAQLLEVSKHLDDENSGAACVTEFLVHWYEDPAA